MKKIVVSAACLFVLSLAAGSLNADELTDLKQQVNQLQQKIDQLEAKQNQQIAQDANRAVEQKKISSQLDSMKWTKNIKINGDLRYRFEMIDEDEKVDRVRNRIRARLGFNAEVTDDVMVGLRLATSEPFASDKGDPISTNQTLDDAFSKKTIWLDLAYFKWSPKSTGLNVFGGKMENPFFRAGSNQLVFDSDLTPEGMAAQWTAPFSENDEIFANGGGFWINEVSSGADTSLWGIQGGLKHKFADKSTLTGGAGYYNYGNIEGSEALVGTGFQGNSNAGGKYINDYDIAQVFGEYGFNIGKKPAAVFADYVVNTSARTSHDTGWLAGGKYGKCKDAGSWEFTYNYRDIQADAVPGAFNDSDFVGGGTNGKGHCFGYTYQLAKNLQGALTYFLDDKGDDDHNYDRLQADLNFKF
jgi:hypothetical protein